VCTYGLFGAGVVGCACADGFAGADCGVCADGFVDDVDSAGGGVDCIACPATCGFDGVCVAGTLGDGVAECSCAASPFDHEDTNDVRTACTRCPEGRSRLTCRPCPVCPTGSTCDEDIDTGAITCACVPLSRRVAGFEDPQYPCYTFAMAARMERKGIDPLSAADEQLAAYAAAQVLTVTPAPETVVGLTPTMLVGVACVGSASLTAVVACALRVYRRQ
jgi:hypothetical protein